MIDEIPPLAKQSRTTPAILGATVLGVGWLRPAPGTWGSLAGLPLAWLVMQIPSGAGVPAAVYQTICAAAIFLAGIPICTAAASELRKKDPGEIVYDELAAMPFVFLLVPLSSAWIWLAGFALFRLFDIVKPPPIKRFERLRDGLGVMADDVVAAFYANIALQILVRVVL
jgi:phosphatidylglycerophosphatase A